MAVPPYFKAKLYTLIDNGLLRSNPHDETSIVHHELSRQVQMIVNRSLAANGSLSVKNGIILLILINV
ncbi:hypothetical protein ACUXCC_003321 [Cytobacillus horneckiae]|uniref:Uncharacterized protein n=1 Tax=Cytobacillus horneckiae TaxID=549687 RepID=A0A2N0ZE93_9BACI|nr:hypothetical protein CWS20_17145 [Cytobacillus horneckiae]